MRRGAYPPRKREIASGLALAMTRLGTFGESVTITGGSSRLELGMSCPPAGQSTNE